MALSRLIVSPRPNFYGFDESIVPEFAVGTLTYTIELPKLTSHVVVIGTGEKNDIVVVNNNNQVLNADFEFNTKPLALETDKTLDLIISVNANTTYIVNVSLEQDIVSGPTITFAKLIENLKEKRLTTVRDIQQGIKDGSFEQIAASYGRVDFGNLKFTSSEAKTQALNALRFSNEDELQASFNACVRRIRNEYPLCPSDVANAALVRLVGYLADAPHYSEQNEAGYWLRSGAGAILKPYRSKRVHASTN